MIKRMIVPPTRATAAADELRRRILEGDYPAGMPLRQAILAEELGISRIPFREALILLEAEGLVQLEAHKGAVVAGFSPEEVEELFEFRALLEPALLEKSAPLLTEADYAELDAILREYSDELRTHNPGRWGALNTELHSLLYRRAGSPRMLATTDQLLKGTDRFARMQLYYTDGRARAEKEHLEIVSECRAGNVKKAAKLLRQHILAAGEALVTLLRERQQSPAK
ncbi:GntR family transcriptional regulator [Nordella sp. HKS 07]|uniref:GntR family transcriptional regulator n=1 Tax=Nordella sp. HKS 07 TaxID=2712222 RepID=UPI0013E14321|nr:GntR family transcriptional regulator [Nordella sp. HKS 07]QIG52164.1 GntR family transcriptional regulator [Nordella sp. HKS 07]